jgi:hypothetical protein
MPAPLYFIEGCDVGSQPLYESLGLGYALAPSAPYRAASTGPGGEAGIVVSRSVDGMGFYPDQQVWHDFGSCGVQDGSAVATGRRRVWVGWFRDRPPAPRDLLSDVAIAGHETKLFDDQQWSVPIAVRCDEGQFASAVPSSFGMSPDGQWRTGAVKPRYQRLWEIAQQFWDAWAVASPTADGAILRIGNLSDLASEVLSVNYRATRREVAALGLLDSRGETALAILRAAIDWPTYVAWSKKKTSDHSGE